MQHPLMASNPVQFYDTAAYACSYLPGRIARSQVADTTKAMDMSLYSALMRQGFRRSGGFVYRPLCDHCQACQSIRVAVGIFQPNRSQKRAWRQHAPLVAHIKAPGFSEEHYALFRSYQQARHPGGGMAQDDKQQYVEFLVQSHVTTRLVEFRLPAPSGELGALKMVSVIDLLDNGLSAVYTFFDPQGGQSLGTFNVLWQLQYAAGLGLPYVYLGYWIEACQKMAYKTHFKPNELLRDGQWHTSS